MLPGLHASAVLQALAGRRLGHPVYCYARLGSSNDEAKRLAEAGAPEGVLVLAETQTAGRGRQGRRWQTPAGAALALSLVLRPPLPARHAARASLLAGLAMCEALERTAGTPAAVKWPNDVMLGGRKAGGILVEAGLSGEALDYLVLGVGVNVSQAPPPESVLFPATSVEAEAGRPVDRLALLSAFLERLEAWYGHLPPAAPGAGDPLHAAWRQRLLWQGQRVVAGSPQGDYHGTLAGVAPDGALLLALDSGEVQRVVAADVSLRVMENEQ